MHRERNKVQFEKFMKQRKQYFIEAEQKEAEQDILVDLKAEIDAMSKDGLSISNI